VCRGGQVHAERRVDQRPAAAAPAAHAAAAAAAAVETAVAAACVRGISAGEASTADTSALCKNPETGSASRGTPGKPASATAGVERVLARSAASGAENVHPVATGRSGHATGSSERESDAATAAASDHGQLQMKLPGAALRHTFGLPYCGRAAAPRSALRVQVQRKS
jgi:hypothetical protein